MNLKKQNADLGFFNLFILSLLFLIPLVWSKFLNANYYSAKMFLFYLAAALALIPISKQIKIPHLPKSILYCLVGVVFFQFLSPIINQGLVDFFYLGKFLSFSILAYYFYQLDFDLESFLKKYDIWLFFVCVLILFFSLKDFYEIRIIKNDIKSGFLLGSFGNVNMQAEFLILTLPFIHYWVHLKTSVSQNLKSVLLFGWFFFILYCRSRSTWIAGVLWFLWSLYNKKITVKDVVLFIFALICFQLSFIGVDESTVSLVSQSPAEKQESFRHRLHLYQSALRLIGDHPFGVGVGHFGMDIVPYLLDSEFKPLEYVYFDQPHSEILKWAAQFGWFGAVTCYLFLFFLGLYLFKNKNFLLSGVFLVLLPQVAFQFPFENPASLLFLCFCVGLFFKQFPLQKVYELQIKKRVGFAVLSLLGCAHAFAFVFSILMESSHQGNLDMIRYSCEVYPINVNACFNREHYLMATNNFSQAKMAFAEDLERFPYHSAFFRLIPIYLKNKSTEQKTCEALLMYNYIFDQQKFFGKDIIQGCQGLELPVVMKNPKQFNQNFLSWQQSLFK